MAKKSLNYYLKNLPRAARLFLIYLKAGFLLRFAYEKQWIANSRYLKGNYKNIAAVGWKWILDDYHSCKHMRVNRDIPWPVSGRVQLLNPENIKFHPDDWNNFQSFGIYFQAIGQITIGRGTYIAPNVGIITSNHDVADLDTHCEAQPVVIGENCWLGMNSMILPGVTLGEQTIVGAGSIVTRSFPKGHCVIAGTPAKLIKTLAEDSQRQSEI